MRTQEVMALLAQRHAGMEWAFIEEVPNATGGRASRSADALALNMWPSRGLELHGFEVKVSRGDWLRELKDPGKADEIFGYCDRWWVVAGDKDLVKDGELPPTWGLLVPRGDGLAIKVQAPPLQAKPLDRLFIASMVRRATAGMVPASVVEAQVASRAATQIEQWKGHAERAEKDLEELREQVRTFRRASGLSLDRWDAGELGAAVKLILEGGVAQAVRQLGYVVDHAKRTTEQLERELAEAKKLVPEEASPATGSAA